MTSLDFDQLESVVSAPRLAAYLREAQGSKELAASLYLWNADVGVALWQLVAHLEVAVRNAMARELDAICRAQRPRGLWLNHPTWFSPRQRSAIRDAKAAVRAEGITEGRVIAQLMFGFWVSMVDPPTSTRCGFPDFATRSRGRPVTAGPFERDWDPSTTCATTSPTTTGCGSAISRRQRWRCSARPTGSTLSSPTGWPRHRGYAWSSRAGHCCLRASAGPPEADEEAVSHGDEAGSDRGGRLGLVTQSTDPSGAVTAHAHDALGRETSRTTMGPGLGSGITVTTTWTPNGDMATQTVDGVLTEYTYDNRGRLIKEVVDKGTGKLELTTEHAYDAAGRETATKDPRGVISRTTYDSYGMRRVTKRIANCTFSPPTGDWRTAACGTTPPIRSASSTSDRHPRLSPDRPGSTHRRSPLHGADRHDVSHPA